MGQSPGLGSSKKKKSCLVDMGLVLEEYTSILICMIFEGEPVIDLCCDSCGTSLETFSFKNSPQILSMCLSGEIFFSNNLQFSLQLAN